MERAEVLDDDFEDITVVEEDIDEATGWQRIDDFPRLWNKYSTKHRSGQTDTSISDFEPPEYYVGENGWEKIGL